MMAEQKERVREGGREREHREREEERNRELLKDGARERERRREMGAAAEEEGCGEKK